MAKESVWSKTWHQGLLVLWLLPLAVWASPGYEEHPQAQRFIERMVAQHDMEREWVTSVIAEARRSEEVLEAIARPAERVLEWKDYRGIFIRDNRIEEGVAFWREHAEALERAEREFGVPASLIVAVIGVETLYGAHRGRHRVLDALASLGFDYPPRGEFFTRELEHYLLLVREQGFDPSAVRGSYAGAMGYGQFISSSYRNFAIDFDGDGVADIIENPVDAIGSVANYFARHDWREGEPVVVSAHLDDDADRELLNEGLRPRHELADFAAAGIVPEQGLPGELPATAWRFIGEEGEEFWLGLHNFYVITRYNHSAMYAMAVYQLARKLEERKSS